MLVEDKKLCCGCGACVTKCPKNSIKLIEDEEGFLYPAINTDTCIHCDACELVCPIIQSEIEDTSDAYPEPLAFGGWNMDDEIRMDSSSGGAFSLFAKHIINNGGVVFGAAMCEDLVVRHIKIDSEAELTKLRGSKYIQSIIGDSYEQIKELLKQGRLVLFTGTPCQAAGLKSYLNDREYNNLFVIDFICHGIPSPKVFRSYIDYLEKNNANKVVKYFFRTKTKGWNPKGTQLGSGTLAEFSDGKSLAHSPGYLDCYMNGFSDDAYLRLSCYDCKFKKIPKHYSDITLADFWGVNKSYPELNDGKGTSLVLINNSRGKQLFDNIKSGFHHMEVDYHKATKRNPSLTHSVKMKANRSAFFRDYQNKSFDYVRLAYMSPFVWGCHKFAGIAWGVIEKLVKLVLSPILRLFGIKCNEALWKSVFQFIKFAMIGVSNVLVSYSINVCTLLLLGLIIPGYRYDYVIANTTAFILSVYWSYFWNSRKVFAANRTRTDKIMALFMSYASYAFSGIILSNVLSTFWISVVGVSKFISPLLNIPITMPINFFILKKLAFRSKTTKCEDC